MQTLFKNHKRKTSNVTVQGEEFTLTQPSVIERCEYFEFMEKEFGMVKEGTSMYVQHATNIKVDLLLVAFCLKPQYSDLTVEEIHKLLIAEITDPKDVRTLIECAEGLSGLKIESADAEEENSQEG